MKIDMLFVNSIAKSWGCKYYFDEIDNNGQHDCHDRRDDVQTNNWPTIAIG